MATNSQRLLGQDTSVHVTVGGALETEALTDIMNFNSEMTEKIISQGYLGERANRVIAVHEDVKFDFELSLPKAAFFGFAQTILNKNQGLTPDTIINVTTTLLFPDGSARNAIFGDAAFGSIPMNIAGRAELVKVKISGSCGTIEFQEV